MINAAGIALLKEFERGRDPDTGKLLPVGVPALKAYDDGGGVWTISWGLTGRDIVKGTVWTEPKAVAEFDAKLAWFAQQVLDACINEPNENQLSAMVCLAFNIGMGWSGKRRKGERDGFRQSTVLRMHNAEKYAEAAAAFSMWNKDNGQVRAGLTRRRAAEASLYLTPTDDRPQTTRATPDAAKDPATAKVNPVTVATGISVAAGAAQQAVANVSSLWDSIAGLGIHPTIVMLVLGAIGVAALGYFVYDHYARRQEGDR